MFFKWRRLVPAWLEVEPVELPGRGARTGEPLQTSMAGLTDKVVDQILPHARGPFALFGHSLGALLAYELSHALRDRGANEPLVLFVSAAEAPCRPRDRRFQELTSKEELLADVARLKGTPAEALNDGALMEAVLPALRADYRVCASYRCAARQPLTAAICALAGRDDTTSAEGQQAWSLHTSGPFSLHSFPGEHFFIRSQQAQVLRVIESTTLERVRASHANDLEHVV